MPATLEQALQDHHAGRLADAELAYREILTWEPDHPVALNNLGMIALVSGHYPAARDLIARALAIAPEDARLHDSPKALGLTLFHQGFRLDAKPWLERAAARDPGDADVQAALARTQMPGYLEPTRLDAETGMLWRRYPAYECSTYVYSIDIVGTCNLRCPTCPVANMRDEPRAKGMMSVELFERIAAKIREESPVPEPEIWLFNWGEPLLHPDLPRIVGIVKSHGMSAHLSTNLNVRHGLEAAVKAGPASLKVSLSGTTPRTYGFSHAGGDIHLVKSNLYRLRYLLDRHRSGTRVWVGFHLYRTNLEEAGAMRALCAELGFEYRENPAVFHPIEKVVDLIEGRGREDEAEVIGRLLAHPLAIRDEVQAKRAEVYDCELRFNMTTINHDGSVALCCGTYSAQAQLGVQFLEAPHTELEERKYRHDFCRTCYRHGLQYTLANLPAAAAG